MKKFLFLLLVLLPVAGYSQRHLRGVSGVEVNGGVSDRGAYGLVGYSRYLGPKLYWKVTAGYEKGSIPAENAPAIKRNYSTILGQVGAYYSLLNLNSKAYLNVGGGGAVASESVTDYEWGPSKGGFAYGPYVGGEAELYLADRLVFLLNGNYQYLLGSDLGATRIYGGVGLKYCF